VSSGGSRAKHETAALLHDHWTPCAIYALASLRETPVDDMKNVILSKPLNFTEEEEK
jgi:hypothetical protein